MIIVRKETGKHSTTQHLNGKQHSIHWYLTKSGREINWDGVFLSPPPAKSPDVSSDKDGKVEDVKKELVVAFPRDHHE